jgi:hypothetical protein
LAPTVEEKKPSEQGLQTADPTVAANEPAGQAKQVFEVAEPTAELAVPSAHSVH